MSEQQAPPVDTPEIADTPERTGTQEQPAWEERYKEAQAWGTQNAQRVAELERYEQAVQGLHADDPDTRQWAAQVLGIEFTEDEEDDVDQFDDPVDEVRRELAEMKAWRDQLTQQERQQATEQRDVEIIGEGLGEIQKKLGRDLSQEEIGLLGDAAWSNRDERGLPNIAAVVAAYEGVLASQAPKPRPRAPHFSSVGKEGTQAAGPLNHVQRVERAMEKLQSEQ